MSQNLGIAGDVQATSQAADPAVVSNEASLAVTTTAVAIRLVIVGIPIGVIFWLLT